MNNQPPNQNNRQNNRRNNRRHHRQDQLQHWLLTAAPFSELDASQRQSLSEQMKQESIQAEQSIGSFDPLKPASLWLIGAGEVALLDLQGNVLETRGPGEVFGHAIVFDSANEEQIAYVAKATTTGWVAHCPAQALKDLALQSPPVAAFLSARLGDRLRAIGIKRSGQLADLGLRTPITGSPDQSIVEAAKRMSEHGISSLPILDQGKLVGILTDRDLRVKVLAGDIGPSQSVGAIMTSHPITASKDTLTDDAMLTMMRAQIHHLPIVDEDNALVGMVSAGDLLRTQAPHPLRLARDVQRAPDLASIVQCAKLGPDMLAGLVRAGSDVSEVGRVASLLTDTITQRLLQLAQDRFGDPPMDWCWVAFGSQARMEQGLISDQDNGLILAKEPSPKDEQYFVQLATFVCDGLNACGYVYCNGGVMAMGQWRMSLEAWKKRFVHWMQQPDPESVMNCSIFFDQRAIAGKMDLVDQLQQEVLENAKEASIFLRFLAGEAIRHGPALGLFNRFVQERDENKNKGINLKKGGVLPIVDLARVRALEGAISKVHTQTRLEHAAKEGVMNAQDADDLIHALRFIGNVRLQHQVKRHEAGLAPNHLVNPEELSGLHQRYLRSAFSIIRRAHLALSARYQL